MKLETYIPIQGEIQALVYDGTEEMAKEIVVKCSKSEIERDDDDDPNSRFVGLLVKRGKRMDWAHKGDYLIWSGTSFELKYKGELESEFRKKDQ